MTLYGWDASHYDGPLSRAILARAAAEGIAFFTHKIAEGLSDTESTMDDTALAAARDAGIPFVGGYFVPRTLDSAAQVDYWWGLLNAGEPWWRDFGGWFSQIDLERWPYDQVSAVKGIDCAKRWRDKTGRATVLYASRSQYGDTLGAWDGPLWNADYRGGPGYPGDGWVSSGGAPAGWAPYSGRVPDFLQFTSSATIAGLTTCDRNAYRGTLNQLAALLGGTAVSDRRDPMPFLARAGSGQHYVCDGMQSQPVTAADAATLAYLATSPFGAALSLARSAGGTDNAEWGSVGGVHGIVRLGWTPAFGMVVAPVASVVLTDAQVAVLADRVASDLEPHLAVPVVDLRGKLAAALGAAGAALSA